MNYNSICRLLGYNPDVQFVRITETGQVSFTSGQPHELRELLYRVRQANLKPCPHLVKTVQLAEPTYVPLSERSGQ